MTGRVPNIHPDAIDLATTEELCKELHDIAEENYFSNETDYKIIHEGIDRLNKFMTQVKDLKQKLEQCEYDLLGDDL